uniref:Uncharacterized protein n=1 Tax=Anguilla anguilla TaxID=7936 RepID=A0A0E9R622_ANGAN
MHTSAATFDISTTVHACFLLNFSMMLGTHTDFLLIIVVFQTAVSGDC